jgi:integrase
MREDAVKYIERGKVSAITQNNRQRVFNGFFNFCVKRDWMTDNPLAKYDMISVRESEKHFFSVEEVQKILSLIKDDKHKALMPYIILMLMVGLRNEETRRLKWEKLNFQSDHVYIRIGSDIAKTNSRRMIQTTDAATRLLNYCVEHRF